MLAGTWLGDHFAFGATSISFRNTLTQRSSFVGTMTDAALSATTSADLRALGSQLTETVHAGFGHVIETTTTQQVNVVGTTTTELVMGPTELVTRVHQPGGFTAESAVDAAGKPIRKLDENGVSHHYTYDVLGRLVHLDTPDGGHTLAFDSYGRPARVTRDGIGAVTYAYDPTTGLPIRIQHLDALGAVTETSDTLYDATGRPIQVAQTAPDDAAELSFDYDGQVDASTVPGQLGRLTRVRGDGWERSTLFDPLGRAYEEHVTLDGWRDLTSDKTYRADGSVASDTLTIRDAGGATKLTTTTDTTLDSLGRISTFNVNGAVLYTLSYDSEGRLARADFTSGEAVTFDYDPTTHQRSGHALQSPTSTGGVAWERDPRGLIAAETYANGTTTTRRDYGYDGRGALRSATSGADSASYTYTASGLPDSVTDLAGTRSVHHTSEHLTVGDVVYTWDAAGRIAGKGEWTFRYGANGQLVHASRPGRQLDFVYDDGNHRLLKRSDGIPVRADVASGVLTEDHFVELVTVGGVVAGVLDNGQFTALLTDARGTPFAGPDGTTNLATAYGVRASHLALSEVLDYARLGWDPDLDLVRMGVRDYDAKLSQFLTPDPLYFADLDKCQASPLQCSLYGYAGGNPVSFVDPTGTDFFDQLFANASHDFVTGMTDPSNYVQAAKNVAIAGLVGATLTTGLGEVSMILDGPELIAFNAALAGTSTVGTTTLGSTALAMTAEVSTAALATTSATAISIPTATVVGGTSIVATALPVVGQSIAVGAGAGAANALSDAGSVSRVGRWMSPNELDAMQRAGRVQPGAGGVHRVALPADPNAYKAAPAGDVFATYDVPTGSLQPAGTNAWRQIVGPDSLQGRLAARQGRPLPEFPAFLNLNVEMTK